MTGSVAAGAAADSAADATRRRPSYSLAVAAAGGEGAFSRELVQLIGRCMERNRWLTTLHP
jgi:hypothetical protein